MREVRFAGEPLPVVPDAVPVDGHRRWADDHGVRRMMPREPTHRAGDGERGRAVARGDLGPDHQARTSAASWSRLPKARTQAAARSPRWRWPARWRAPIAQVVLVDLRGDGADSATMGEGTDLPGFTDLFAGEASFAQVIFRDRTSRVHFIPAGRQPISAEAIAGERLTTILGALDHTYDHLVIDAGDELIGLLAPTAAPPWWSANSAPPIPARSAPSSASPRSSSATILLLVVDPSPPVEAAVVEKAHAGEEAA